MTPPIPTAEPSTFIAGDTVKWTREFAGYPATDSWVLTYVFQGPMKLEVTAAMAPASGTGWAVTIPAASTASLTAGVYKWQAYVTKASERFVVASGVTTVQPNLAVAPAGSQESPNEKMLAAIQAVLQGRALDGIESYSIAGRAVNKIPVAELLKLETHYLQKVHAERNPDTFGRKHLATFVRP